MNTTSKYALTFLAFVIMAGLMAFPVLSSVLNESITTTAATVYAQSQSVTTTNIPTTRRTKTTNWYTVHIQ
jgi:uncharacterized protein (UPF0333 family)